MTGDRLGRGLNALLGEYASEGDPAPTPSDSSNLLITHIKPNPMQPRQDFGATELNELADSIRLNGLLQPIVVRPRPGGTYQLVAGERRFRAIQMLGWAEVPALVRDVDDKELLVLALVENLQREALSPLEEAEGYRVLTEDHGLTQAEVAKVVAKSRPAVANALRLLGLPPSIRRLVEAGNLSAGHARALLGVADPARAADLARQAVKEGWSVREVERRVKENHISPKTKRAPAPAPALKDLKTQELERAMEEALATRVSLTTRAGGTGTITLPFSTPGEFERLFELITGKSASDTLS